MNLACVVAGQLTLMILCFMGFYVTYVQIFVTYLQIIMIKYNQLLLSV